MQTTEGQSITPRELLTLTSGSNPKLSWGGDVANGNKADIDSDGSVELMNGVIIKWGQVNSVSSCGTATTVFPTAFPTGCFSVKRLGNYYRI